MQRASLNCYGKFGTSIYSKNNVLKIIGPARHKQYYLKTSATNSCCLKSFYSEYRVEKSNLTERYSNEVLRIWSLIAQLINL